MAIIISYNLKKTPLSHQEKESEVLENVWFKFLVKLSVAYTVS